MKRILCVLCIFCIIFTSAGISVYSAEEVTSQNVSEILDSGKCGDNLFWELDSEGLLRIFGTGPMYDYNKYYEPSPWYKYRDEPYISEDGTKILDYNGDVYLSTEGYYANNPNGYKVKDIVIEEGITYIGDWAFYRVCVEEINVPEGVEATGIFCFRYSPMLKELYLPDSLKVLDDYAISRNYALETLHIGNSLETVGTAGFNYNTSLKEIILPDTCTTINKQLSPTYASIDYSKVGLMENCSSLKTVSFGSVTDIPQRTCSGTALKSVVIPNTAESIDSYAFFACESLEEVVFEEGSVCTKISDTAFSGCTSLQRVKGGTSLKTLGLYTSFSSLCEFDFSATNESLLNRQFLGTALKEVTVSDNITVIPVACFNSMSYLEKIYLPGTLAEIKASSFNHCESLKDVYFDGTRAQWGAVIKASGWSYKINPDCKIHFADGTSDSLWYTPAKFTVIFIDFDGTVLETQQVEEGKNATAPADPVREGYTFTGWDKELTFITEDTVITAKYSQNEIPAPVVEYGKLKIDVSGGKGFSISVNGGNFRPQGLYYVNSKMPVGASVTVVAKTDSNEEFIGWVNEYGAIVSTSDTYTFTSSGNDYVKAVYMIIIEDVNVVVFKNAKAAGGNGQILDLQYYAAGDEVIFPDAPAQAGFVFVGWSMTANDIRGKLLAGEDATVVAEWERAKVYIDVTVNGGKVITEAQENGKYLAYGAVTVVADTPAEGKKFAYWTDATGKVLSYSTEYKFYPAQSTELTAVFVSEDEAVEKKAVVFLAGDPTTEGNKITYTVAWELDDAIGTITNYGLMVIDSEDYNADTFYHGSGDSKLFDRTANAVNTIDTKSMTLDGRIYDHTYNAVGFIIYKDAKTGESITVYSDMIETFKPAP